VLPVVADFMQPFDLPNPRTMPLRNVVYFPGSTIGNFEYEDALNLLRVMHAEAGADGALLIGVDLQKDPAIVNAAYNDSAGVTAKFNLNILRHLNRAFGSDFNLDAFAHRATYRADEGRVVVELVSAARQAVHLGDARIEFEDGESIITEYSHKYTLNGFADMAAAAGFEVRHVWTDPQQGTLFGRYEFLRCGRPAGEEEFLHLCLEELPGLGLDRRQAVLIDQHCLVTQPALPRLPGNVVVDTLPKFARVRRIVEAFRLFTQQDTFNRA
jgi:hypothetical protein